MVDEIEATAEDERTARELTHQWIGLPAFERPAPPPRLVINFESEDDRRALCRKLGIERFYKGYRGALVRYVVEDVQPPMPSLSSPASPPLLSPQPPPPGPPPDASET